MPWLTACRACHQTCCRPSTSITFGGDRLGEHCSTGSAMLWGDDNEEGLKGRSVGTVWIIRGACLKVLRSKAGGQNSDPEVEEWESCLMLFPISQMFCKGYRWLLQHGFIEHCGCFTMMSIARVHLSCPYLCRYLIHVLKNLLHHATLTCTVGSFLWTPQPACFIDTESRCSQDYWPCRAGLFSTKDNTFCRPLGTDSWAVISMCDGLAPWPDGRASMLTRCTTWCWGLKIDDP
jgi:hypothetical protein